MLFDSGKMSVRLELRLEQELLVVHVFPHRIFLIRTEILNSRVNFHLFFMVAPLYKFYMKLLNYQYVGRG